MLLPLEDRWGGLSVLEYEHGATEVLLQLLRKGDLSFQHTAVDSRKSFIEQLAVPFATNSFRQAKEFFRHAETSSWLVKPLLLYYGMLTAAKASITFSSCDFFVDKLRHGLSRDNSLNSQWCDDSIVIQDRGVYPSAREALQMSKIPAGTKLPISEILARLPEVTGAFMLFTQKEDQKFILTNPAWIARAPKVSDPPRLVFDLPKDQVSLNKYLLPQELESNFELIEPDAATYRYASWQRWNSDREAQVDLERGIIPWLSPTLDNRAAFILPIELSGTLHFFTELELIYLITFYFSEIARYSPHIWLQLHSGESNFSVLLCQAILRTCESKFLSLLANKMIYTILMPFSRVEKRPPLA